jgi:hypothetical protein
MAMDGLHAIVGAGTAASLQAVAASETIQATDDLILNVHNGNAGTVTITINDKGVTPGGSQGKDVVITIANGAADKRIAVPAAFADPATGLITVGFSPTSSVTAEWLTR